MYTDVIEIMAEVSNKKVELLNRSKIKYMILAAMAGMYVGFGILLIYTIGGYIAPKDAGIAKVIMGVSFAVALSLVLMAGSELFTGNNMIMTVGALKKKVTWKWVVKIWIYSYIGNLIGSIIIAFFFVQSGLAVDGTSSFILKVSAAKMSAPIMQLFFRGILCNILVCLATWCFFKLREETAKLIIIFWCLFAFITSGYEHSIANMTLFSTALMIPHDGQVSLYGAFINLSAVSIGNMIGGAVFLGAAYYYVSKK